MLLCTTIRTAPSLPIKFKEENGKMKIHSFLMMGQSNMAGRADFNEVEKIENSLCFMLRMGNWVEMSEPINVDRGGLHSGIVVLV